MHSPVSGRKSSAVVAKIANIVYIVLLRCSVVNRFLQYFQNSAIMHKYCKDYSILLSDSATLPATFTMNIAVDVAD